MLIPRISDQVKTHAEVLESQVARMYVNVPFSTARVAYRLDYSSGSLQVLEETGLATGTATNSWNPFGASVIPASAVLRVYDSTDGVWATNALSLSVGSISDLRSAGWKQFVFGENVSRQSWRPSISPTFSVPSRRYILFELDDSGDKDCFLVACESSDIVEIRFRVDTAGGPSTAVRVSDLQILRREADRRWRDRTVDAQGSTATAYTPVSDTALPTVGSRIVFGFDNPAYALEQYVFRGIGAAGATFQVRATGADTSMLAVSGYTDPSNHLQTGVPTTTAASPTEFAQSWSVPTGWTKRSYGTLAIEGGSDLVTPALYYLEYEITAVSTIAPSTSPINRVRARQFGAGNVDGFRAFSAKTFRGLNLFLRGPKSGTGDRTLQVSNLSTGDSRTVTIPGASLQGDNLPLAFASPLVVNADEEYGLIPPSGGGAEYQDVEMEYAT